MCDVNSTVEVHTGENATIHCSAFPNAQYKWTKVTENRKTVNQHISAIPVNFTSFIERQDDLITSDIKTYSSKASFQYERYLLYMLHNLVFP